VHDLVTRLAAVRGTMAAAAAASDRPLEAVSLLAVSKGHPAAAVCVAYDAGQRDFGENYADELDAKATAVAATGRQPRWHFTGALQRNKVATVLRWVEVVHSVDRLRLAVALSDRCGSGAQHAAVPPLQVYLQVNLAGEANKAGVSPEAVEALARAVVTLPGLQVAGLMAVPPDPRTEGGGDADASAHRWFDALAQLSQGLQQRIGPHVGPGLSMGMSHDFATAIGAGATLVRVGTALFGNRVR
jgi:pyridoxal phosphate enzyme (YggS family)